MDSRIHLIQELPSEELQDLLQIPMANAEQIDRMLELFEGILYSSYVRKLPPEQIEASVLLAALEQIWLFADGIGHKRGMAYYRRHLITLQPALNHEAKIQLTEEYCAAARNLGDPIELAEAYRQLGTLYRNNDMLKAQQHFDTSLEYANKSGNALARCYTLTRQATLLINKNNIQNAIELLEEGLQYPDNSLFVKLLFQIDLSTYYFHNNQLEKAIAVSKQFLTEITTFSKEHNAPEGEYIFPQEYISLGKVVTTVSSVNKIVCSTYNNLAQYFDEIGVIEKTTEYYYAGLALAKKIGNFDIANTILVNIAHSQRNLGDKQEAIHGYTTVLQYCRQHNRLPHVAIKATLGIVDILISSPETLVSPYSVEELFTFTEEFIKLDTTTIEFAADITVLLIRKARFSSQQSDYTKAYDFAIQAIQHAEKLTHRHNFILAHIEKVRAVLHLHHYEEAIALVRSLYALALQQNSLIAKRDVHILLQEITPALKQYNLISDAELLQYAYDYIELQKALYEEESQKEVRKLQILHQVEDYRFRLEQERQSKEHAQELLEQKNKELLTNAMLLIQKNEILQNLQKKVAELHCTDELLVKQVAAIKNEIRSALSADKQWKMFEKQFATLNERFVQILKKRFPTLSKQESKIVALLRIGLSSKDISNLFSLDIRTVENHRANIRKKMGLSKKQDLELFLRTL